MAIASKSGRGICSVNRTVTRLMRVRIPRRVLSALATIRCGTARITCTSGRQRAMRRSASKSTLAAYTDAVVMVCLLSVVGGRLPGRKNEPCDVLRWSGVPRSEPHKWAVGSIDENADLEVEFLGSADGGPAVVHAELGIDALGVGSHGVERHREFASDVRAAQVGSQQPKNLALALAQRLDQAPLCRRATPGGAVGGRERKG